MDLFAMNQHKPRSRSCNKAALP